MTDSDIMLEALGRWCLTEPSLKTARLSASVDYFGHEVDTDRPGAATNDYVPSVNRRFIGWFMFDRELTNGMSPAVHALTAREFSSVTRFRPEHVRHSLGHSRYVLGLIAKHTALGLTLECGADTFQVRTENRAILRLPDGQAFAAHLVPDFKHPDYWAVGPGWVGLTIDIDPQNRGDIASFQPSPIEVEAIIASTSHQGGAGPTAVRPKGAGTVRNPRFRRVH